VSWGGGNDFFGYGEDSGLAGDLEEAVEGLAAEPAGPVEAAVVEGAVETVAHQRFGDEAC
jgi:hypothetical protein